MTTTTEPRTKPKAKPSQHPLDALAQGDPRQVIALMLWQARHRQPDMFIEITERDLKGLQDCADYLKVKPAVMIKRPQGLPAQAAVPAQGNRRAVPARAATPPKNVVVVALVEEGTENTLRPVENNQGDYDVAQSANEIRKARDDAPRLAESILRQARTGEFSLSEIQDAANTMLILARSHQL